MPDHAKPEVSYGDPISLPKDEPRFYPLPQRPAAAPEKDGRELVVTLDALDEDAGKRVTDAGRFVFHAVGDTGNDASDEMQEAIAKAMQRQIKHAEGADRPSLFYLLGDVVYPLGESAHYDVRFYKPYKKYDAPIVAIAGNHDGYGPDNSPATTLEGWKDHFLGGLPKSQWFPYREPQSLPHVYWELETPVANIIGLYSNVDGHLDKPGDERQQQDWLTARLRAVPKERAAVVAVHHPPYSLDSDHGGSPAIADALDAAAESAGRWPDAVFSGHVHSYQRFTRVVNGRDIPYVVAGAGGRAHKRKKIAQFMEREGFPAITPPFQTRPRDAALKVELVAADVSDPGFLLIDIGGGELRMRYFRVPFDEEQPVDWQDAFVLDLTTHKITNL
jgi:hypothetical protein